MALSLRLPARLEYIALRAFLRVFLGKERRNRLLSAKVIDIDEFMIKHSLHKDLGFSRSLDEKRLFSSLLGLRIVVPRDQTALVREVQDVYLKPDMGNVVVDVGAHYGFYTLLASILVGTEGRVLAFEPCSENYRNLLTNLETNRIRNVRPYELALSDFEGITELRLGKHSAAHSIVLGEGGEFEVVRVARLDTVVQNLHLSKVDLVKVDAEGSEVQILKGAVQTIRRFQPRMTIAAYHFEGETEDVSDWLGHNTPFYDLHCSASGFVYAVPSHCESPESDPLDLAKSISMAGSPMSICLKRDAAKRS